jgi:hypothetical protein
MTLAYSYETPKGQFEDKHRINLPIAPFTGLAGAERINEAAKSIILDFPPDQKIILKYNPQNACESIFVSKAKSR